MLPPGSQSRRREKTSETHLMPFGNSILVIANTNHAEWEIHIAQQVRARRTKVDIRFEGYIKGKAIAASINKHTTIKLAQ